MWALGGLLFLKLSSSSENGDVLVRASVDLKRHHDHGKGRHLTGVAYSIRLLVHRHHGGTWQCRGRHGAGGGAESSRSSFTGNRK